MELFQRINLVIENHEKGNRAALCKKIGVNPSTFIGYLDENGQAKIKFSTLARICEAYPEVNRDWLLFGEGNISNDPRELKANPEYSHLAQTLNDVLHGDLTTTPETFAEIGGITKDELTAMLSGKILPPMTALRNWALRYRINLNFLVAQIGYPLLTRGQYEQNGPLMWLRKERHEDEYPRGCANPSNAESAEHIDSDLYDGEPYEHDRHKKPLPEVASNLLCPGTELPLIGLAQCGVTGWSLTMPLAATSLVPTFHKDMIAALAIGDSMVPAGINPGNTVYCDPKMEPLKGEPIFVIRRGRDAEKEGEATIKLFVGRDDEWLYMKGWLQKNGEPHQKEFEIKQLLDEVETIAPVVMIRRRV